MSVIWMWDGSNFIEICRINFTFLVIFSDSSNHKLSTRLDDFAILHGIIFLFLLFQLQRNQFLKMQIEVKQHKYNLSKKVYIEKQSNLIKFWNINSRSILD